MTKVDVEKVVRFLERKRQESGKRREEWFDNCELNPFPAKCGMVEHLPNLDDYEGGGFKG